MCSTRVIFVFLATVDDYFLHSRPLYVTAGSPLRDGDVKVYILGYKPTELAHSFYSIVVVFAALSTIFHFVNSSNSPFFHSVLPVLFLPYWSIQLYISI